MSFKKIGKISVIFMAVVLSLWGVNSAMADETPDFGGCEGCHAEIAENFMTSLHYTGATMKSGYELGAAAHFGIDMDEYYANWNCSKCHATTCEKCHEGGHDAEITIDTCDQCHFKKQTSTYIGDMPVHTSEGPNADIHYEKGLICTDCHNADEMHGDGTQYSSQLDAVTTTCEGCHVSPGKTVKDMDVTQYSPDIEAHSTHEGKLDCTACHSGWVVTCENCHLDTRKGTTFDATQFYLGVAADGKVNTFMKMTTMDESNATHTLYGEWFAHTVTDKAKDCAFCHENKEVLCEGCEGQILRAGSSFLPQDTIDRIYGISTMPAETATEVPATATPEETSTPGFEVVICIGVLAIAAYLGKRR